MRCETCKCVIESSEGKRGGQRRFCKPPEGQRQSPCSRFASRIREISDLLEAIESRAPSATRGRARYAMRTRIRELLPEVTPAMAAAVAAPVVKSAAHLTTGGPVPVLVMDSEGVSVVCESPPCPRELSRLERELDADLKAMDVAEFQSLQVGMSWAKSVETEPLGIPCRQCGKPRHLETGAWSCGCLKLLTECCEGQDGGHSEDCIPF